MFYFDYCKIEDRVTKFVTKAVENTGSVCCTCSYHKPQEDMKEYDSPKPQRQTKTGDFVIKNIKTR